jgi:Predicted integral membrane protein (DUF2269)
LSYYEVLLFVHVLGVAIWLGTGFALLVLGDRFGRAGDNQALHSLFGQSEWLATRVFIPVSLTALVTGILLVIEGPWAFDQLWVLLGLAGFAATFLTGLLMIKPESARIAAELGRDGMTPEAARAIGSMFARQRIDYTVIALVVADMTLKPTGDDVLTLVLMAAVLAAVVALVVRSERGSALRSA